jgi:hypothetical protein
MSCGGKIFTRLTVHLSLLPSRVYNTKGETNINQLIAEGASKLATLGTVEAGGDPGPGTPDNEGGKRDKESGNLDVDGEDGEDEDEDFGLELFS